MDLAVTARVRSAQQRYVIDDSSKVGEARRAAQTIASFEFTAEIAGKVAIAATEMANNLLLHANGGELLVQALGDALSRLDQQLLRDVRSIATEHEIRREEILGELQGLAIGIGMFRAPLGAPQATEEIGSRPATSFQQRIGPGDWRQATSNIENDIDFHANGHINGRVPSH